MTDTSTKTITDRPTKFLEEGDHEKCSHIVLPKEAVTEAYILGTPVVALCGKTWVPTRDPKQFPVCEGCKEEFEKRQGQSWGS